MNRKDFELIARALKVVEPRDSALRRHQWESDCLKLAHTFDGSVGCSGFDRAKFLKACGVINAAS